MSEASLPLAPSRPPPFLIGVTGKAGAGKSTLVDGLGDLLDNSYPDKHSEVLAFAGPLKEAVSNLFCIDHSVIEDRALKETPTRWSWDGVAASPRLILQKLGTDVLKKHMGDDFFLRLMEEQINWASDSVGQIAHILISDVRFDNEAELILSRGGIILEVTRPGAETTIHSGHASEAGISRHLITATIENTGTIEELTSKAVQAINNRSSIQPGQ